MSARDDYDELATFSSTFTVTISTAVQADRALDEIDRLRAELNGGCNRSHDD